jgi:hypothetical protein
VIVRDLKEIQSRGHREAFNAAGRYEKHAKLLRASQKVPLETRKAFAGTEKRLECRNVEKLKSSARPEFAKGAFVVKEFVSRGKEVRGVSNIASGPASAAE